MSLPLHDLRTGVDECTNTLLDAYSSARGMTKAEITREILRAWADRELLLHRKVTDELKRTGLSEHGETK